MDVPIFFAPLRESNQAVPRAVRVQVVHAKAQRREDEMSVIFKMYPLTKNVGKLSKLTLNPYIFATHII